MDVTIHAERLDGPSGLRLLEAFSQEISGLYPGWDPTVGPSAAPDEFVPPQGVFLVAYGDHHALGCGGVKLIDDAVGEVKRVCVLPEARSRGIARQLLAALEDAARELGCRVVRLDTGDRQPEALSLFRSAGYEQIPDYNANPYASYWFEKSLV